MVCSSCFGYRHLHVSHIFLIHFFIQNAPDTEESSLMSAKIYTWPRPVIFISRYLVSMKLLNSNYNLFFMHWVYKTTRIYKNTRIFNKFLISFFPTGYYMIITANRNLNISSTARLMSFPQPAGQVICVSFWYHIFGNSIGTCFTVYSQVKSSQVYRRTVHLQHFLKPILSKSPSVSSL